MIDVSCSASGRMSAGESTVPWGEESITAVVLYGCSLLFSTTEIVTDMLDTERVGTQLEANMVSSNYAVSVCLCLKELKVQDYVWSCRVKI